MKKAKEGRAGMCLWENLGNAEITKSKFLGFLCVRSQEGESKEADKRKGLWKHRGRAKAWTKHR